MARCLRRHSGSVQHGVLAAARLPFVPRTPPPPCGGNTLGAAVVARTQPSTDPCGPTPVLAGDASPRTPSPLVSPASHDSLPAMGATTGNGGPRPTADGKAKGEDEDLAEELAVRMAAAQKQAAAELADEGAGVSSAVRPDSKAGRLRAASADVAGSTEGKDGGEAANSKVGLIQRLQAELEDVERQLIDIDGGFEDDDNFVPRPYTAASQGDRQERKSRRGSAESSSRPEAAERKSRRGSADSSSRQDASAHADTTARRKSEAPPAASRIDAPLEPTKAGTTQEKPSKALAPSKSEGALPHARRRRKKPVPPSDELIPASSKLAANTGLAGIPTPARHRKHAGMQPGSSADLSATAPLSSVHARRKSRRSRSQARDAEHAAERAAMEDTALTIDGQTTKKKKKRRRKKRSSARPQTAGVSTRKHHLAEPAGPVTRDLIVRSSMLKKDQIQQLVSEPIVKEACRRLGLDGQDLIPKPLSEFTSTTSSPGAHTAKPASAKFKWQSAESARQDRLADVLRVAYEIESRAEENRRVLATMQAEYQRALEDELERIKKQEKNAARLKAVADAENAMLEKKRKQFEERQQLAMAKAANIKAMKAAKRREAAKRAKEEDARRKKIQDAKLKREQQHIMKTRKALNAKEEAAARLRAAQAAEDEEKKRVEAEREEHRRKVREQTEREAEAKRKEMLQRQAAKEAQIKQMERAKQRDIEEWKTEKWMRQQEKDEAVARMKRQKEYEQQQIRERLEMREKQVAELAALKQAIAGERQLERKKALIERHMRQSKILEKNVLPGPGEYYVPSPLQQSSAGFAFSKYTPKTDLDITMARAAQMPGPGAYLDPKFEAKGQRADFGKGVVPTDIEWKMKRAAELPGPAQYEVGKEFKPDTPSFSMGNYNPKSQLELTIARASEMPGPGQYGMGDSVFKSRPRTVSELRRKVMTLRSELDDQDGGWGLGESFAGSPGWGGGRSPSPSRSGRGPRRSPVRTPTSKRSSPGRQGSAVMKHTDSGSAAPRRDAASAPAGDITKDSHTSDAFPDGGIWAGESAGVSEGEDEDGGARTRPSTGDNEPRDAAAGRAGIADEDVDAASVAAAAGAASAPSTAQQAEVEVGAA